MCALAKFLKYGQHTKKTEGLVQSYSSTAQIFSQIAYYLYLFSLPQMAVIVSRSTDRAGASSCPAMPLSALKHEWLGNFDVDVAIKNKSTVV